MGLGRHGSDDLGRWEMVQDSSGLYSYDGDEGSFAARLRPALSEASLSSEDRALWESASRDALHAARPVTVAACEHSLSEALRRALGSQSYMASRIGRWVPTWQAYVGHSFQ
jgi:hypothetical protein